jgi:hypothetical protein
MKTTWYVQLETFFQRCLDLELQDLRLAVTRFLTLTSTHDSTPSDPVIMSITQACLWQCLLHAKPELYQSRSAQPCKQSSVTFQQPCPIQTHSSKTLKSKLGHTLSLHSHVYTAQAVQHDIVFNQGQGTDRHAHTPAAALATTTVTRQKACANIIKHCGFPAHAWKQPHESDVLSLQHFNTMKQAVNANEKASMQSVLLSIQEHTAVLCCAQPTYSVCCQRAVLRLVRAGLALEWQLPEADTKDPVDPTLRSEANSSASPRLSATRLSATRLSPRAVA